MYCVVQPFGVDQPRQVIVLSEHPTVEEAYDRLDLIAQALVDLQHPPDRLEIYVTDEPSPACSVMGLSRQR